MNVIHNVLIQILKFLEKQFNNLECVQSISSNYLKLSLKSIQVFLKLGLKKFTDFICLSIYFI